MKDNDEYLMQIWEMIKEAESIALFRHVNPDADAYGAQFGLAQFIVDNFPMKQIFCYGENIKGFEYLYENGTRFYENRPTDVGKMLVISLDTANLERLDFAGLTQEPTVDIKIDHHPPLDGYARVEFVDVETPATCAILLDVFLFLKRTEKDMILHEQVLEKLYAGIVGDTGNFRYGNGLNQHFFANIGVLFACVNTKKILGHFFAKTLAEVKFAGALSERIKQDGAFAFVEFTSDFVDRFGVNVDYATSLVYLMQDIIGVEVWASFCEDKTKGMIRCSLRSHTLDVSAVAQTFGGGGHRNASGVRIGTWAEVEHLKSTLQQLSKVRK